MRYEVEMTRKILYTFSIEANNDNEAEEKAYDLYNTAMENGTLSDYKYDEDTECSIGNPLE